MGDITNTDQPGAARVEIPGVELVKAGTWGGHALTDRAKEEQAENGGIKITPEIIAEMAAAASDPMIDEAPMKYGHFSAMFGDGAPATGWVKNLRVSDDGNTLVGDLVDIPVNLYPMIKSGFKKRSIELKFDQPGTGGRVYKAALSALALLGGEKPAVKGLNDLADLYASEDLNADTAHIPHPAAVALEDSSNTAQPGENNNEGESPVDILDQIKEKLGLDAEASDADVLAALEAALADAAAAEDKAGENDAEAAAGAASALSAAGAKVVTVSEAVFSAMQSDIATLREAEQKRSNENMIEAALSAGKITTDEAPIYLQQLENEQTRAGAAALLSSLPEQKVSTVATPAAVALSEEDATEMAARWAAQNK